MVTFMLYGLFGYQGATCYCNLQKLTKNSFLNFQRKPLQFNYVTFILRVLNSKVAESGAKWSAHSAADAREEGVA